MELSIRDVWERRDVGGKLLWFALLPAAAIYRSAVQLRNFLFARGWLRSVRLPRPVISVGNLTVGGTGKTPTCLWLAQELTRRGFKVGILSRGYKRKANAPVILRPNGAVTSNLDQTNEVQSAGDEPLMMARLYGQTVGVSRDRAEAAASLLREQDVDVFILDDGFQHRRVKRDIDLLLLGQDCAGWLLPAGPFREPKRNLTRADFWLTTGGNGAWRSFIPADHTESSFTASLSPISLVGVSSQGFREFPLTSLYRSKILTVTGIADPRGLYRQIHEWEGEIVDTLEFPDHHSYTARDWQEISRMARLVDLVITTEKDILKLCRFPFAKDKLLALRVAMTVQNGDALVGAIVEKLEHARGSAR
jgi:tetraacyldisaccharide 4'-kinase